MHNWNLLLITLMLCLASGISSASTAGADAAVLSPNYTMTPQEYEAYRTQLQLRIQQANPPTQNKMPGSNTEKSVKQVPTDRSDSGYGQGYRARTERNDSAARMNARGNSGMHRGGGRNR